jgi:hypothetical protein
MIEREVQRDEGAVRPRDDIHGIMKGRAIEAGVERSTLELD